MGKTFSVCGFGNNCVRSVGEPENAEKEETHTRLRDASRWRLGLLYHAVAVLRQFYSRERQVESREVDTTDLRSDHEV